MTVSADPLPTVQIDGVAWTQVVIGNTVYVGGSFTTARPAGAAPGVNTTTRVEPAGLRHPHRGPDHHLGADHQRRRTAIVAVPGQQAALRRWQLHHRERPDPQPHRRLDPTTGALVATFQPKPDATVRAIAATTDTVYFGGVLSSVTPRRRGHPDPAGRRPGLATARCSPGRRRRGRQRALLALSPTGDKVIVGGSFTTMNGSGNPGYGLAAVDPARTRQRQPAVPGEREGPQRRGQSAPSPG